jgi:putative heme-binding domain-containing protein
MGSTYRTIEEPFLLTTDDGWFRPVDLKAGPDGALYIADLYEKRINHVDPRDTWDRSNGRIWRIRPTHWKWGAERLDLARLPGEDLVKLLGHESRWHRATARRVLADRKDAAVGPALSDMVRNQRGRTSLESLWALFGVGGLDDATAVAALGHTDAPVRMWAVRLVGDEKDRPVSSLPFGKLLGLAKSESDPQVRSQLASTAKRLSGEQALPVIRLMLSRDADAADPHIPLLLWWALEDKAVSHREHVLEMFKPAETWRQPLCMNVILPRLARRYATNATRENQEALLTLLNGAPDDAGRKIVVSGVKEALAGGPVKELLPPLREALSRGADPELALRLGDPRAVEAALKLVADDSEAAKAERLRTIELLGQVARPEAVGALLDAASSSRWHSVRKAALAALSRLDDPALGQRVVRMYPNLPKDQDVRPAAVTMLASRPAWGAALLRAVEAGHIPKADIPAAQVDRLRESQDKAVAALAEKLFGKPARASSAELASEMGRVKVLVTGGKGDAAAGKATFVARCATCHTLFGEGGKTAPDLTGYERRNAEYLVFNIVDPSAAVREEYTTFRVKTTDGQSLDGLIAERGGNQITLVDAAGQRTVIPKDRVAEERALPTSLMPEGLLAALSDQQLRDFFAYLSAPAR